MKLFLPFFAGMVVFLYCAQIMHSSLTNTLAPAPLVTCSSMAAFAEPTITCLYIWLVFHILIVCSWQKTIFHSGMHPHISCSLKILSQNSWISEAIFVAQHTFSVLCCLQFCRKQTFRFNILVATTNNIVPLFRVIIFENFLEHVLNYCYFFLAIHYCNIYQQFGVLKMVGWIVSQLAMRNKHQHCSQSIPFKTHLSRIILKYTEALHFIVLVRIPEIKIPCFYNKWLAH